MTEPVFGPTGSWKLRVGAALVWLAIAVLGLITHSLLSVAIGVVMALIWLYRARQSYTRTRTRT